MLNYIYQIKQLLVNNNKKMTTIEGRIREKEVYGVGDNFSD